MRLGEVLERKAIPVVFQPILALADGGIVGHEALVRGPAGTWLESPTALFAAAREAGTYERLAVLCIQETLRAFSANGSRGLLFLNMSPRLVQRPGFDPARRRARHCRIRRRVDRHSRAAGTGIELPIAIPPPS